MLHFRVGSWPYPQTLDYTGKAYQEHHCIITNISKKIYNSLSCLVYCLQVRPEPTQMMLYSRIDSWPYPQTLDYTGKAYQGLRLYLITNISKKIYHSLSCLVQCLQERPEPKWVMLHSRVGSWPYPQILGNTGKAYREQSLYLITNICKRIYNSLSCLVKCLHVRLGPKWVMLHSRVGSWTYPQTLD
jgi:hypothetical protein